MRQWGMPILSSDDRGPVRVLTMNRPEARNALSGELRARLLEELALARGAHAVRAVVLTGAGRAFSAGMDLRELERIASRPVAENRLDSREFAELLHAVYTFPKPVVAAVNGPAVAGGAGLASVCDFVVMGEGARIGYTEARIGFVPALVAVFLTRVVGERHARDLLLSGRLVGAEEAARIGLVNRVVADAEVLPAALEVAARWAANAPSSLEATKSLLAAVQGVGLEDGLRLAVEVNALARAGDDLKEGVRAFLEKREPRWPGIDAAGPTE